jgi:UDP-N-acetyl-D-glucosamine/UDP-N-acetyl-D-galactosamine dehydrogenase
MSVYSIYKDIENKKRAVAVIGLGYVGIPLLVRLANHFRTVGFDINEKKVNDLRSGDNLEDILEKGESIPEDCILSSDEKVLKDACFFIITVPTPVDSHNNPDIGPVKSATRIVARNMPKNSIILYESTVFPGLTEDICIPIIKKESGYSNNTDFKVGYSPERINPGDRKHSIENIVKVISAQDKKTLDVIEKVYSKIIKAGLYRAESIKVAEAAKVIENIQRDLNIALINELAIIFSKLNIDTIQVLKAAGTKWNFLDFRPGMVGGHCIGVDPFYLTYKAQEVGYHPEIILSGRRINDNMSYFIGNEILKKMLNRKDLKGPIGIALFGITFKENVRDIRNSKVIDLYNYLKQYGINLFVCDPVVDRDVVYEKYGIKITDMEKISNIDAAVFCVAHNEFRNLDLKSLRSRFKDDKPCIFDIKSIFNRETVEAVGFDYWRL